MGQRDDEPKARIMHTTPSRTTLTPLLTWVKNEYSLKTPPTRWARPFLFDPLQWLEEAIGLWAGYKIAPKPSTCAISNVVKRYHLLHKTLPSLNQAHSSSMCAASPDCPDCIKCKRHVYHQTTRVSSNLSDCKKHGYHQNQRRLPRRQKTRVGSKASAPNKCSCVS